MKYSPKLKIAMGEIKAILDKHDIAGTINLHTPGFGEFLMHTNTSYSCAKFEGDFLRIKAKLQEDFKGDKKAQMEVLNNTVNMLLTFLETNGHLHTNLVNTITMLKKYIEIDEDNGDVTSHTTQNN